MKKVTVALFASIMLGAFGACKNEPDNIYVTVSPSEVPPVIVPPTDHTDHTEYRPVSKARKGQGGTHATTTTLWFALSEGNFDNSTPQDVVYTISGDESNETPISLQKVHAVDYEEFDAGTYWHVYSVGISTPITANGYVSFDLSSEPDDAVPYEYHVSVTVPVYYAEPVQVEVKAKNDNADRGTTELTVTPANAKVKLARVWVRVGSDGESTLTPVVDGVVSITNRNNGNKSVTVEVKNADEVQNKDGTVKTEGSFDAGTSEGYYVGNEGDYAQSVGITPAVPFSVTFEAKGEAGRGTTALKLTAVGFPAIAASNYEIFVDETTAASAVGTEVTIENRSDKRDNPKIKVVLAENADTNGYADFTDEVGITPAVKAVEFTANGVEDVVGTTAIEAKSLFAVNTGMFVSIDGGILQPISSTEVTLLPVVNRGKGIEGTQKTQVTVKGEGQENGYYIPRQCGLKRRREVKREI